MEDIRMNVTDSDGTGVIGAASSKELQAWTAAAKAGDGAAACRLGDCFRVGKGVKCNPRTAFRWYLRGAWTGDEYAMNNLGACYHNGFGCAKNVAQAIHWYRRAVRAGSIEALDNFGRCYMHGDGVPKDSYRAADLFRSAHARGHPKAAERLAEMGLEIEPTERAGYDNAIEPTDDDGDW